MRMYMGDHHPFHIAPSRFRPFHTIFMPLPKIFTTFTPTKPHVLRYVPRKECEISANGINRLLALFADLASYSSASNFLSSLPLSVSWVLYRFSDATAQVSRTSVEDPSRPSSLEVTILCNPSPPSVVSALTSASSPPPSFSTVLCATMAELPWSPERVWRTRTLVYRLYLPYTDFASASLFTSLPSWLSPLSPRRHRPSPRSYVPRWPNCRSL